MMGFMKILKPGLYTTIQDLGRYGYGKYGVPRSGAMDQKSYKFANMLLGNNENDAVLEWTSIPPVLQFHGATSISLTGAISSAFLNGKPVPLHHQIKVEQNDVLEFGFCEKGVYGYVGIRGGFLSPIVLQSRSFFKTITEPFICAKNHEFSYQIHDSFSSHFSAIATPDFQINSNRIKIYTGPEFDQLSKNQKVFLLDKEFTISNTRNRMAIQLEERLSNDLLSMLTSPVLPGTIQLTPSGKLIVLMRDCQTTGGYPRVLQLAEEAINLIAQKRVGEKIFFHF